MNTGIAQAGLSAPVISFGVAVIVIAALVWLGFRVFTRKREPVDPLNGLFDEDVFELTVEAAERRISPIKPRSAVIRAQIDQLASVRSLWGQESRDEAIAHVAQVMRAGVRHSDSIVQAEGPEGDGSFIILAHGASEKDAGKIARRLLARIAQTSIHGIKGNIRLSASVGVAERLPGESEEEWRERAEAALGAAQEAGDGSVMAASEWEEVKYLPSPTSTKTDGSAAA